MAENGEAMTVRFDDSLPRLITALAGHFGAEVLSRAAVIRDAGGRLSVTLPIVVAPKALELAAAEIGATLGSYARPERFIADAESPGTQSILTEAKEIPPSTINGLEFRMLDRRIVGADWLRPPSNSATRIPRIIFGSLKGGVGRSTALCVLAAHLSRRGRRVLAIDFDLEAPGIGSMLLREAELPRFGTLDYLVENGLSGIDGEFLADLAGDSILGAEGARVSVVPAIGQSTIKNPENTLGKIARAYLEDFRPDSSPVSLSEQLLEMVDRFEATESYDVTLIDSRAGLHETAAAAILALGGDVLFFGVDQPQTFLGYRLLLANLTRFPINLSDDLRDRIHFVHAKSPELPNQYGIADEKFLSLYDVISPKRAEGADLVPSLTAADFDVAWDEADSAPDLEDYEPPAVIHVFDDARYRSFDPVSDFSLLASPTYSSTFRELLEFADLVAL